MGGLYSKFVFAPPKLTYTNDYPHKVLFLKSKSGKTIPAYFLPFEDGKANTTILYSHGNAADMGGMYDYLRFLRDGLQVNVMHYDYIGYGLAKSQGKPSEQGVYESAEAAFEYLITKKNIDPKNIILLFGTSLGSGPTCHLASKYAVKGIILECGLSSVVRVVTRSCLGRPFDMFVNCEKIKKARAPVLVIHGTLDDVVPFDHGLEMYDAVPAEYKYVPVWVKGATHHNIVEVMGFVNYLSMLKDFIEYCTVFASLQLPKVNRKGLIPAPVTIDKKKPLVTVHIILHDGEFLQQQFNEEHTIYAIIDFINRSTGQRYDDYALCNASTNRELSNTHQTLKEAYLSGFVVLRQHKKISI